MALNLETMMSLEGLKFIRLKKSRRTIEMNIERNRWIPQVFIRIICPLLLNVAVDRYAQS